MAGNAPRDFSSSLVSALRLAFFAFLLGFCGTTSNWGQRGQELKGPRKAKTRHLILNSSLDDLAGERKVQEAAPCMTNARAIRGESAKQRGTS